jgi:hypothetical protein
MVLDHKQTWFGELQSVSPTVVKRCPNGCITLSAGLPCNGTGDINITIV